MTRILLGLGFMVWGLSAFSAWKDWHKALCGLIVFTAIYQQPDMPRAMLGVPGLNPWNLLLLIVLLAWMHQRRQEGLRWDMPKAPGALLLLGLSIEIFGFIRLLVDAGSMVEDSTISSVISEYLVDPMKWVIVGLLLFDGSRNRNRLMLGLASILSFYVVIGLQVLRAVLPGVFADEATLYRGSLSNYAMMEVATSVGIHRNDVSVLLAGAFWALITVRPMVTSPKYRTALVLGSAVTFLAQISTGGRAGFLAWCVVGLALGLVRSRRYLLLAPLLVVFLAAYLPNVTDRALHGLSGKTGIFSDSVDLDEVTSGRTIIWPLVMDKIWDSPLVGYGRAAMQRTGVSTALLDENLNFGNFIDHPHNAYLEMLLDAGLVGLFVTLILHGIFLSAALSLLRDRRNPEHMAMGSIGLSVVLALLVGAFTGQSFWPRVANFGMWCAVGLLLRVWADRSHAPLGLMRRQFGARSSRTLDAKTTPTEGISGVPKAAWWRQRETPRTAIVKGSGD